MRNVNELIGIIKGISFDGIINQFEVNYLLEWVNKNRNLSCEPKQTQLIALIDQILEDRIITDEERDMLLQYCKTYMVDPNDVDARVYELNGIIEGITCDNEINNEEVRCLQEWMSANADLIRVNKASELLCKKIEEEINEGVDTAEKKEALMEMLTQLINQNRLEAKIEHLKRCVKDKKIIGIDLIDLLDNEAAIEIIHNRAEAELLSALNSYSGIYITDPDIVFISLVLIAMLHYDGSFYDSVRITYEDLYNNFSSQKIEGLIRTTINRYRSNGEVRNGKARIINTVLSNAIVPSYYLESFFEFIYDIYRLNFDSDLPSDLHKEFQFVYEGLRNVMLSDGDDVQINVTKKTYKLIHSTKLLFLNEKDMDAVIRLSIIVVRLIDKYIWNKDVQVYNPYLKRGYEKWVDSLRKEKNIVHCRKQGELRSRWEPKYLLSGTDIFLLPPTHKVKSQYDYQDIFIVVRNEGHVIYSDRTPDIREIIGGYEVNIDRIKLTQPLGKLTYQLLAGDEIIYDSKDRLNRDFIVFNEQGQEIQNNTDYSGTAIFCTQKPDPNIRVYHRAEHYYLSSVNVHIGDTVFVDKKVFNFSELVRPGIVGDKHTGIFIKDTVTGERMEVYKNEVILVFESDNLYGNFDIQINYRSHKLNDFEYSVTKREGINKYLVHIDTLGTGIYELNVASLKKGKRDLILSVSFSVDKELSVEQIEDTEDACIVSVTSGFLQDMIVDRISATSFDENWFQFNWKGKIYTYFIPFEFKLYRIDEGAWRPFSDYIWIGEVSQGSQIDIYGTMYERACLLTSTGQFIEETPALIRRDGYCRMPLGFLESYKATSDYVIINLLCDGKVRDGIFCYNKCILDGERTEVSYNHRSRCLEIIPRFYGKGNLRFKIVNDQDEIIYTSTLLSDRVEESVSGLDSFTNYKVIFFVKEKGLSLKKERILKVYPVIFYDRNDFVGKSFKIKEVYFDQLVRGEFLRKKHFFNTTYVFFAERINADNFKGEIYARTYKGAYMLDDINPVDIEVCSDVIDGIIELSITKDGDGLLLDFEHHGVMNSMDDGRAVDIYSYSIDMKGEETF